MDQDASIAKTYLLRAPNVPYFLNLFLKNVMFTSTYEYLGAAMSTEYGYFLLTLFIALDCSATDGSLQLFYKFLKSRKDFSTFGLYI